MNLSRAYAGGRWRGWMIVIALAVVLFAPILVSAHALLISAEPDIGSTLNHSPRTLRLTFDQPIASQSTVRLLATNFVMIDWVQVQAVDAPNVLEAQLPALQAGVYTVEYDVLSADGDLVQGSYEFAVSLPMEFQDMFMSDWLPVIYFLAFLLVAVGWRVYRVWRLSGVNALTAYHTDGVHGLASNVFRLVFAAIAVVLFINAAFQPARAYLVPIEWLEIAILPTIGWVLLAVAFIIIVIAQVQMGSAWRIGIDKSQRSELVTHGIFRYSRNPIFLGIRVCFFGLFLVLPTAITLLLWVLGDVMMQIQVQLEESHLTETFGEPYLAYSKATRRWI